MHADNVLAAIAVGGGIVTVLGGGGVLGWWWRKQPQRDAERARSAAVADAILGEPAVQDRSGEEIQPARPGLVHRVGTVEDAVKTIAITVADLAEMNRRVTNLEGQVGRNTENLAVIMAATAERIITKTEAAEMWRAIADRDVVDGEADET